MLQKGTVEKGTFELLKCLRMSEIYCMFGVEVDTI